MLFEILVSFQLKYLVNVVRFVNTTKRPYLLILNIWEAQINLLPEKYQE